MGNLIQGGSTDLADILGKNGVSTEDTPTRSSVEHFDQQEASVVAMGIPLGDQGKYFTVPAHDSEEARRIKENNPEIDAIMKTLRGIAEKSDITVELPSHPSERSDTNGHDHKGSSEDNGSEGDGDSSEGQ